MAGFGWAAAAALLACTLHGQTLPCFAYRQNNDVLARCGSARDILLRSTKHLMEFAIFRNSLALLTASKDGQGDIRVVDGAGVHEVPVPVAEDLYTACETILATAAPPHQLWDIFTGRPLDITNLSFPVCGPGRRVLAGTAPPPGEGVVVKFMPNVPLAYGISPLCQSGMITFPPEGVSAPRLAAYGVSPSGQYFAFTTTTVSTEVMVPQICTVKLPAGVPVCYYMPVGGAGSPDNILSVNDAGQVLYTGDIMQTCRYYGEASQDVVPSKNHSNDTCRAVYVASPTLVPTVLVPYGTNAQWVSEASVKALLAAQRKRQTELVPLPKNWPKTN